MDKAEYERTRKLPERKRATRNGKRCVDAFLKSCRDRMVVEHPDWVENFDTDLRVRLLDSYFYFTKYISARWEIKGYYVFTGIMDYCGNGFYTDNILRENGNITDIALYTYSQMFSLYLRLQSTFIGRLILRFLTRKRH